MSVTKKNITTKLYLISLLLIVVVFSVIFKLIDLQFFQGDYYIEISEKREFKNIEIPANRGNIYSDSGKLLASSVPKYNIRFDALAPTKNNFDKHVDLLALELSKYFENSSEFYSNKLRQARKDKNRYLLIARNLGYLDYKKFKDFPLFNLGGYKGGFISEQSTKRDYPIGGVAQRTVG